MLSLSLNSLVLCSNYNNLKPNSISGNLSLTPSPYIPAKPPQPQKQQQLYQPFKPPPSPLPSHLASLDTSSCIQVLTNRLGQWHAYAPLITSLLQHGLSPSSIEEATGITVVEQNLLVVASQVRHSLIQSNTDPLIISAFDIGGEHLLYEIRLLNATQRASAATYIVENRLDREGAQELARAMKDFPSRKGDEGWESFDYTLPGDCLAFMYYRQSKEHRNPSGSHHRNVALEQALQVAQTEKAKSTVFGELKEVDAIE